MAKDRKIDMVILGLLAHEDMSGYDIKKKIDGQIRFFWKGSFGSIYPALAAMEEDGLVKKLGASGIAEKSASGGREKFLYSITSSGRKALKSWLSDEKAVNDLKYETLLKLFFGGVTESEVTIRNIELFEKQVKEDLQLLKLYQSNLKNVIGEKDHVYYYLTVSFGVETYEAYLKWCKEAKTLLAK